MTKKKTAQKRKSKNPNWNKLGDQEKLSCITNVLTHAGSNQQFRKDCLDPKVAKKRIAGYAGVTFDADVVVKCFTDQVSKEKWIMLDLPPFISGPPQSHVAADYWLCTYPTYPPPLRPRKRAKTKRG